MWALAYTSIIQTNRSKFWLFCLMVSFDLFTITCEIALILRIELFLFSLWEMNSSPMSPSQFYIAR